MTSNQLLLSPVTLTRQILVPDWTLQYFKCSILLGDEHWRRCWSKPHTSPSTYPSIVLIVVLKAWDSHSVSSFSAYSETMEQLKRSHGTKAASTSQNNSVFGPLGPSKRNGWHHATSSSRSATLRSILILSSQLSVLLKIIICTDISENIRPLFVFLSGTPTNSILNANLIFNRGRLPTSLHCLQPTDPVIYLVVRRLSLMLQLNFTPLVYEIEECETDRQTFAEFLSRESAVSKSVALYWARISHYNCARNGEN